MLNRKNAPVINEKVNFIPPQISKSELKTGTPLIYSEKTSLPIVYINFAFNFGSINDPQDKQGLTNLLAVTIDEGANGYTALEIDEMLESLGTLFSISVDTEFIFFSIMTLKKNLSKSLEILSWILQKPNFTESDFNREKNRILSEVLRLKDNPSFVADYMANITIYKNTPYAYSKIGNSKTIRNIELNDVKNHYRNYISSKNSQVIVVGNITQNEFIDEFNKYFSDFNIDFDKQEKEYTLTKEPAHYYLVNKKGASQSEIRIANIASGRHAPDFFGKKLANSILGGQFSSRLNHNLREEKGITYGVNTVFSYSKKNGIFLASTAVDTKNTLLAITEFQKEFELITSDISEEEISFSKSYYSRIFPLQFSSYSKISSNIANLIMFDLPLNYYESFIDEMMKTTHEDILRAARENILPENQQFVIVGDADSIMDKLLKITDETSITRYELDDLDI